MTEYESPYKSVEEHLALLNTNTLMERFSLTLTQVLKERLFPEEEGNPTVDDLGDSTRAKAEPVLFAIKVGGFGYAKLKESFGERTDSSGKKIFPTDAEIHTIIDDILRIEQEDQMEMLENLETKPLN